MGKTKQIKSHQELFFLIGAVLMLIVLIAGISWVLGFLVKYLNIAVNPKVLEQPVVIQFNIEGFKNLGLIKSSQ